MADRAEVTHVSASEPTVAGTIGQPARLGLWLVGGCSAAVVGGVWTVVPAQDWALACLIAVVGFSLAAVNALTGAARDGAATSTRRLLVFPLLVVGQVIALGAVNPLAAQPYLPIPSLAFIYVGLTCPPRSSRWVLPPAVVGWLAANNVHHTGFHAAVAIRLPISIVVWLLTAELLAWYGIRVRRHTDLLSDQAHTDALTGLPNRRFLPQLLGGAQVGDAIVMLDVDRFRQINETHGHAGGDEVLRLLGGVVRSVLRAPDIAVRYGGEEILLLLPGVCSPSGVEVALRRLTDAWSVTSARAGHEPPVTFSAGAAILGDLETPGAAVRAADVQLYEAKQAGRNCWRIRPIGPVRATTGGAVPAGAVVPPRAADDSAAGTSPTR